MKILIIDDDEDLLDELRGVFEAADYQVMTMRDGTLAVEKVCKEKPDVVLIDLKIEGRSGFQVASDIKYISGISNIEIPIICMTGHFTENTHVAFMKRCGIDDYIFKPFSPKDVMDKIDRQLKTKGIS